MTGEAGDIAAVNQPAGARFLGARKAYWRLLIRGAVLLMVTLGIYRFWLITDVRRFLWANSEVAGEALEYTGTPVELLLGFLIAIAILIPVYAVFFLAALDLGPVGQLSGLLGFAALFVLGQYAIYRARRYRLTRTVYRGLRFTQAGSAWAYAVRAIAWWLVTIFTAGLAYPFQLASLERYKMRHTFYGDLGGRFAGAGWKLFLRGLPMWALVAGPLLLAAGGLIETVDWQALADALDQGGEDVMARIEGSNPALAGAIAFAMLMGGTAVTLAALLYPAYQAVVLRWWLNGLRFGAVEVRSGVRMRSVYGAYLRFLSYGIAFSIIMAALGLVVLFVVGLLAGDGKESGAAEIAATVVLLVGYVIAALGFSTIYRATALLSLWQLGIDSLQLSGVAALETVRASGRASSPLGEGLADALNVGGY
jgi:uncharacterized membrane protein YjgN (DUF898 family)